MVAATAAGSARAKVQAQAPRANEPLDHAPHQHPPRAALAEQGAAHDAPLHPLCSDGRLWKLGSCFEDQLDTRPFSTQHYNPTWFDTKGAMCVAYGITTKELAAALETAGIQHLKHTLLVGVNVKDKDDVPHDAISAARPQALYIVPVVRTITTQAQFKAEHLSEHKLKNC